MGITPPFDTGDVVVHRPTNMPYMVACVHGHYLHTTGYPDARLVVGDCLLQRKATDHERLRHLEAMAQSSSQGHRAACARSRLADAKEALVYETDSFYGC